MTSWQRRARIGLLVFGVTTAAVLYFGVQSRRPLASRQAVPPLDPQAVSQITEGVLQQATGAREDGLVESRRSVTYEDGSTKHDEVRITSRNRDGRDFFVTAAEGWATRDNGNIELHGGARLSDSTGFTLVAERADYDRASGIVRVAGLVTFTKGRMSGSGQGASYDQGLDVLRIDDRAQVDVAGDAPGSRMHFTAGAMTLDRVRDVLQLERTVHAIRGEQVIDADVATAYLSPDEDLVRVVQLRGNARVTGGSGSLDAMRARDIDLEYSEDGETLERALLMGGGAVALRGLNGSPGRECSAGVLYAALAPDGAVTRLVGEQRVVMSFPAAAGAPARAVEADRLDASGSEGQSLTSARFSGNVSFRERTAAAGGGRAARARFLALEMSDEAISSAVFTGGATFEEDDLTAAGEEARYEPEQHRLRLAGADGARLPTVADERLRVEAQGIEIELERRALEAHGRVKALLRPETTGPNGRGRRTGGAQPGRLPGLLAPDRAVNVTSARLVHDGDGGMARFSGSVWLWQGETEIRAGAVDVDQQMGDLVATGEARSVLEFESGRSHGRAHEIRYTDETRVIAYSPAPAGTQQPGDAGPRLKGPQGDLAAARIEIVLAKEESRVDRIEGYGAVTAQVDTKTIRGHRFTYEQAPDRYEVTGSPSAPLSVRTESCRENSGSTLTFDRSTDTMTIDGRTVRTLTKNTCREPGSH